MERGRRTCRQLDEMAVSALLESILPALDGKTFGRAAQTRVERAGAVMIERRWTARGKRTEAGAVGRCQLVPLVLIPHVFVVETVVAQPLEGCAVAGGTDLHQVVIVPDHVIGMLRRLAALLEPQQASELLRFTARGVHRFEDDGIVISAL